MECSIFSIFWFLNLFWRKKETTSFSDKIFSKRGPKNCLQVWKNRKLCLDAWLRININSNGSREKCDQLNDTINILWSCTMYLKGNKSYSYFFVIFIRNFIFHFGVLNTVRFRFKILVFENNWSNKVIHQVSTRTD